MQDYIQKKAGYEHYKLTRILVNERKGMKALNGLNSQWQVESILVVPLDGWRGRNLAGEVFGVRNAAHWQLGVAKLVRAKTLQELPGWDEHNELYLRQFDGVVSIEVVAVDPTYGTYIHVTQMSPASEVEYMTQQLKTVDVRTQHLVDEYATD